MTNPSTPGRCHRAALLLFISLGLLSTRAAAGSPVVTLLLDTSGSIRTEDLGRVQTLTRNLLASLPPGFEIAVYKFSDDATLLLEKTSEVQQIEQAIGTLKPEGRHTALYDALFDASEYLEKQLTRQKLILLLSDGKNEGGQTQLEESLDIAKRRGVLIFTVGVGRDVNRRILRRIADQSGGTYTDLSSANGQALAQAIQKALSIAPLPSERQAPPSSTLPPPQESSQPKNIPWLFAAIAVVGIVGGLLLWWVLRTSAPRKTAASLDATTPAPPELQPEPVDSSRTMPVPLPALTADQTVRIQLKEGSLIVRQGAGVGQIFPIRPVKPSLLGRSPEAEVAVQDPTASLKHCRIVPAGVGYVLTDLKSTNGTTVNGTPVQEHVLQDGDIIQIGSTSFEFRLSQGSQG